MDVIRDTSFGGELGKALGQGLQQLAHGKLQQIQQQNNRAKTFQSLKALGAPAEDAYAMSLMPEKLQEKLLPKYLEGLASREEPSTEQPTSGLEQGLAALQGRSQAAPIGEIPSTKPEANIAPGLQTPQQTTQDFLKQLGIGRGPDILNTLAQKPQQQQVSEAVQPESTAIPQAEEQPKITPTTAPTKKRARAIPFKEEAARYKATEDYRDEVRQQYLAAHNTKMDIGRLEKINREGKLPDPLAYKVLKDAGWDILALNRSADPQEFLKIQQNFLKNMKAIFGARISIQEMEQYIQGIPSLLQTPEGRERVFRNFRIMADIAEKRFETMRAIQKESGGKIPLDLAEAVEERMTPYMEQKIKEFQEGPQRPIFKAGDKIDIHTLPAYTVPGLKVTQDGKKWISDGAQWKER